MKLHTHVSLFGLPYSIMYTIFTIFLLLIFGSYCQEFPCCQTTRGTCLKTCKQLSLLAYATEPNLQARERMLSPVQMVCGSQTDVGSYIPKTFYSSDPAADMRGMLESVGFKVEKCEILERSFHFPSPKEMLDAAMAANPFIQRIPEDLRKAYKEDFKACMMTYVDFAPTLDFPDRLHESFWRCMNETIAAMESGINWEGRSCCTMAQSQLCQSTCLMAARSSDMSKGCRRSDEISLFHCLAKQEKEESCCSGSKKAECVNACRSYLKENSRPGQPSRRHGLKKRLNSQCDRDEGVLGCVANLTQAGTPIQNPERNLPCCSFGRSEDCQQACWRALKTSASSDLTVFSILERECGHPRADDKMWQCFLHNAEPKRPASSPSRIDRLGMDAAKLHCCHRAASSSCRRLCHKTYSREWTGSWTEYSQMCLSSPKERDLRDCIDEVEEPCELGCNGLSFCSAFNNRPGQLFRRCNAAADMDAREQLQTWKNLGYIPFMENIRLPLRNISSCSPEKWKAVACSLQIRPCHPRNHASMICRGDCNSLLHGCLDLDAIRGRVNIESICDIISPPPDEPCIKIAGYIQQPKAQQRTTKSQKLPQISRPCKSNPCNLTESCEVNRKCEEGRRKCEPFKCNAGCTLGEVSRMVVQWDTWVRVPQERQGCQRLCHCGEDGRMDGCLASMCESRAPCWLGSNHVEHGARFYLGCNFCSCRSGEVTCTKRDCEREEEVGYFFKGEVEVRLPCGCDEERSPVCGANGRTYPSQCLAKCAGLSDIQIFHGECSSRDPCEGVSCGNGRRCIPSHRTCLFPSAQRCPQFQCVPLKCEESWQRGIQPVCDTSGREHSDLCSLATSGAILAYEGPCLRTGCSPDGAVCGIDGVTYPSECAAEARGISMDYAGPCVAIGTGDGFHMAPTCGPTVKCPRLPAHCVGATPFGACCPVCGGIVQVLYSPHQVLSIAEVTDSQLTTVEDITRRLNSLVQTAECKTGAYLGLGVELIVVVQPMGSSWTPVQLQACISEAERLATLITQQNPVVQVDASLSVLTTAAISHMASTGSNLQTFSSFHLITPLLFVLFPRLSWPL